MSKLTFWLLVGFLGQALFTARFVVQWLVSERQRDSVVPVAFWWLSLLGGGTLLSYAISRRDLVIMVGQAMGLLVYVRNLMLLNKARQCATQSASQRSDRFLELPRDVDESPSLSGVVPELSAAEGSYNLFLTVYVTIRPTR